MSGKSNGEKEQLAKLRALIEEKVGWGSGDSWTHYQFEDLQEMISQATGISLSPNTLKRFFGKIKSDSNASKTTKNTLAQFVGFTNYSNFVKMTDEKHDSKATQLLLKNRKQNIYFRYLFLFIIVAAIVYVVALFIPRQSHKLNDEKAVFSQVYDFGTVPFTQIFKYHFDPKIKDTIYFNEYNKGNIPLSTRDSVFSWMHFVPGFRKVRFLSEDQVLWESSYMVKTDGWLCVFPLGGWKPRKYVPLNDSRDYLTVTDEMLEKYKIDLEEDGGWIHYMNAQDFEIPGTDFALETRIRNELKTGLQQCQDIILTVECETFIFRIHFTQSGCQKFAEINLGNQYFRGIQNDLTNLTFDMNQWQDIRVVSENNKFSLFSGDKLLFEKEYSDVPGNITMLQYSFRGNGEVDDIFLKSGDGKIIYIEDFITSMK